VLYSSHTRFCLFSRISNVYPVQPFDFYQRETRPIRTSVSSSGIGNRLQQSSFHKPLTVATSLIDPYCPERRGAVLLGRSPFPFQENRPHAGTQALPLLPSLYSFLGLSCACLLPIYYMSWFTLQCRPSFRWDLPRQSIARFHLVWCAYGA